MARVTVGMLEYWNYGIMGSAPLFQMRGNNPGLNNPL